MARNDAEYAWPLKDSGGLILQSGVAHGSQFQTVLSILRKLADRLASVKGRRAPLPPQAIQAMFMPAIRRACTEIAEALPTCHGAATHSERQR